jgi:hypothetical protein
MCNVEELLKLTIFGAGIACAGSLMAEEKIKASESGNFSWMQEYKLSDGQEGNAFREEVEMRMRNMSQQEQDLMRSTGVNGRDRVTSGNKAMSSDFEQTHGNFGADSTYGQGFESRQLQQTRPDPKHGGTDIGRGAGISGRQGRGR